MTAAPDRVDALERRVAALEAALCARPGAEACPFCNAALALTAEDDDPVFGDFGVKQRTYRCTACDRVTTRQHDPRQT